MKNAILLLFSIIFLNSCSNKDFELINTNSEVFETVNADQMNLTNLKVGQKFRFSFYVGAKFNINYHEYTGDTLEIEILEVNETKKKFKISEKIINGKNKVYPPELSYWFRNKDSIYVNELGIRNDSLIIRNKSNFKSHLFFRVKEVSILEFQDRDARMNGFYTPFFYTSYRLDLFTQNYSIQDYTYNHLNVVIDNSGTAGGGGGGILIYNLNDGITRSGGYLISDSVVHGWDRIPYKKKKIIL